MSLAYLSFDWRALRRQLPGWLTQSPIGPPVAALLLALAVLAPIAPTLPQYGDENHYAWTAAYYGGRLAQLDFRPIGSDIRLDPAWFPWSYWALTQPMGARFIYALALGVTRAPAPTRPYLYDHPFGEEPATTLSPHALFVIRLAAVASAALGCALIAARLGWWWLLAQALLLALPHVRTDLAHGWAEGPFVLGVGLAVLAFGTPWFGLACGLAATTKLTALGLWPLLCWRAAHGGGRWAILAGALSALMAWVILTPPAWFAGGPLYVLTMIATRGKEHAIQSDMLTRHPEWEAFAGLFFPSRYWLPLELGLAIMLVLLARRLTTAWWRRQQHGAEPSTRGTT